MKSPLPFLKIVNIIKRVSGINGQCILAREDSLAILKALVGKQKQLNDDSFANIFLRYIDANKK